MNSKQSKDSLFFSYGHDNYEEKVKQIKSKLEDEGFKIYFDRDNLQVGTDWEESLENAIKEYEKFIFFITQYSARRPDGFCLNEIAKANEYKKEIIPILLENESLPLSINRLQYIDFQNNNNLDLQIKYLIDVLIGNKNLDTQGMHAKLLASLNPINFTQDFNRHKNLIGREWVVSKVNQWLSENPHTQILWITAEAGYGKSALSVYLANNHPDVIGVHFCSFNAIEKNDPINVIKTMAYNFQSQIDGYREKIEHIDIKDKSLDILVDELILNPLEQITDINKNYLFIIDAIDEAKDKNGNNVLADLVCDKLYMLPAHIKIIITSRPEPHLKQTLSQLNPLEFRVDEQLNNNDCQKFINNKLSKIDIRMSTNDFIIRLLSRSQGNMLYIQKYFEAIENNLINKPYNPDIFPRNLNGLYAEYFNRIFLNIQYNEEYSPIFEQFLIFEDAIDIELLASILGLSRIKLKRRLQIIGSFLKEVNNSYHINHKSIKDWLQDDNNITFQVDMENAKDILEEFLQEITPDTYNKYGSNNMLNYFLLQHYYQNDKKLNNFISFIKELDTWDNRIKRLLDINIFLIEKKEYKLSKALQEAIKVFLNSKWDKDRKIDIIHYYIQVIQSTIINNKEMQNSNLINSYLNKVKTITSESKEVVSDALKEEYANTLLEWSNQIKGSSSKEASRLLLQSKEWNKSIVNKNIDKQSEFDIKYLTLATSIGLLEVGASMMVVAGEIGLPSAGVANALLGPLGVLGIGGIALCSMISEKKIKSKPENTITNKVDILKSYEKNLLSLEKKLNKNPQKWIKYYSEIIFLIIPLYIKIAEPRKAKELLEKNLKIITKLNEKNPNRWQGLYDKVQSYKML